MCDVFWEFENGCFESGKIKKSAIQSKEESRDVNDKEKEEKRTEFSIDRQPQFVFFNLHKYLCFMNLHEIGTAMALLEARAHAFKSHQINHTSMGFNKGPE